MKPIPAIVEPLERQALIDKCEAAIRRIMAPEYDARAYHDGEAKRYRAKAAAARERIGDLLRTARDGVDDRRWSELLDSVGLTAAEAETYLLGQAAPESAPIAPPASKTLQSEVLVYFIQGVDGGPIKIGMSQDPERRLSDLQVGSPVVLRIIGIAAGGQRREAALHRRLAKHRIHGEWFADAPDVLAEVPQ